MLDVDRYSELMKTIAQQRKPVRLLLLAVCLVAAIGSYFMLQRVFAALSFARYEAEAGTLSGAVSVISDNNASSGQAIGFTAVAEETTPLQRAMANAPHYGVGLYWPKAGVNYKTTYDTHVQRVGQGRKPDILRTFGDDQDGVWTWATLQGGASGQSSPTVTGHDGANWHSFKINFTAAASGSQNTAWTNSIKTIPIDGKPKMITIHHEPENDVTSDSWWLNWIKANVEIGKAVKAANHPDVLYGPIFMSRYHITTNATTDKGNLNNMVRIATENGLMDDLNDVYDFIGWDPYNEGSATSPQKITAAMTSQYDTASYYFDIPYNFTQEHFPGKKFAIGETGLYSTGLGTDNYRKTWLQRVKAWVDAHPGNVLAVCYYDASITAPWYLSLGSGGTMNESYQTGVAQYWGSLYKD